MKISMFEKFLENVRPYKKLEEQYKFIKTIKECGIWTALDAARKDGHLLTNTAFVILRFGVFDSQAVDEHICASATGRN